MNAGKSMVKFDGRMCEIVASANGDGLLVCRYQFADDFVPEQDVYLVEVLSATHRVAFARFTPGDLGVEPRMEYGFGASQWFELRLPSLGRQASMAQIMALPEVQKVVGQDGPIQSLIASGVAQRPAPCVSAPATPGAPALTPASTSSPSRWGAGVAGLMAMMRRRPFVTAAAGMVLGGVLWLGMDTGGTSVAAVAAPVAQAPNVPVPAPAPGANAGSDEQLQAHELEILKTAIQTSGIALSPNSQAKYVMFADPLCPTCQQFDRYLSQNDYKDAPLLIPVAFKPGSDKVVSDILCSKNPAQAWKDAVAGKALPTCSDDTESRAVLNQNNASFVALRLNATPTFVTAKGRLASGAEDVQGLLAWVAKNS